MLDRSRDSLPRANSVLIGILLAVLAVLLLAWVTFGLVRSGDDQSGQVADQKIVAQSQDGGADTPAPEAENRNVDSYAAYEAKDPFRQIVEPAEANTGEDIGSSGTGDDTSGGGTSSGGSPSPGRTGSESSSDDGDNGPASSSSGGTGSASDNGTSGGSASIADGSQRGQSLDSDGDKVSNKREKQLGLSQTNPDTDGDGIQDGADDSNGDGRPDRDIGGRSGGSGGRNSGSGGNNGLFDSGGSLLPSGK